MKAVTKFNDLLKDDLISDDELLRLIKIDQLEFPNPWSADAWKNFISSQNFYLEFSADENGKMAFILYQVNLADSFAHLLKILVPASMRLNKMASKLLENSLIELKRYGVSKFFLEVEAENLAAINLYQKFGFKIVHKNKNFYGQNRDALIMTLGEN